MVLITIREETTKTPCQTNEGRQRHIGLRIPLTSSTPSKGVSLFG
jgi:hypothetical protein